MSNQLLWNFFQYVPKSPTTYVAYWERQFVLHFALPYIGQFLPNKIGNPHKGFEWHVIFFCDVRCVKGNNVSKILTCRSPPNMNPKNISNTIL